MFLADVLARKRNLDNKILELEDYLVRLASDGSTQDFSEIDSIVSKIYEFIDERQQQLFTIDKINRSVQVKIGSSKTPLSTAIMLRKTVGRKIDVLTSLIEACKDSKFSIVQLMENKDRLLAEYDILTSAIKNKDWTVEIAE